MKNYTLVIGLFMTMNIFGQPKNTDTEIYDSTHPKYHIYNLLTEGDTYKDQGNLTEAEAKYREAVAIAEPLIASHAPHRIILNGFTIFDPYDRLGYLYLISNNPKKAESYFQKSYNQRDGHLPRKSVYRSYPLVGLAEAALKQHEDDLALQYLEQAEKILNTAMTSFYSSESLYKSILFNKAELLFRKKDYKNLRKVIDKLFSGGTTFALESSMEVRNQIPKIFELQARYYLETGDLRRSEEYLHKARIFSKSFSTTLNDFPITRTEALLFWANGDITSAAQSLYKLTESYKNFVVKNFVSMSEHEKEDFFLSLKADFDLLNAFILNNTKHPQAPVFFEWAYNNQLFSKALLLNESNKLKSRILSGNDEYLKSEFHEWEELKAQLSASYYKHTNETDLHGFEARIEELERSLNQRTSLLESYSQRVDWKNIQSTLTDQEAAVEIIRTKQFSIKEPGTQFRYTDSVFYLILYVEKGLQHPKGFFVPGGNYLEGRHLSYYRNCITGKLTDTLSYNAYWKPIQKQIPGPHKIYLSVDGVYSQLNLMTLKNPATGDYLLNESDIVLVTNTKDLLIPGTTSSDKNASLYGRPFYRLEAAPSVTPEKLPVITNREIQNESLDDFHEQSFTDLPGTEDEISKIQALLSAHQWKVNYFTGNNASESNLKSEKGTPVLHIATHGFFLGQKGGEDINSMIRSGLVLAGVNSTENNGSSDDDGVLTAYESTALDLDGTELVILSACETGLGEIKNGIGVYGLQRGFTVAGARYLLMSLWKVDDASTDFLMQKFYTAWLGGAEIHTALKLAQREMMQTYPHPYHWGAFVLMGK